MATPSSSTPDFGANSWIVEEKREAWQADPSSVSPTWQEFFSTEPTGVTVSDTVTHTGVPLTQGRPPRRRAQIPVIPGNGAAPHRPASSVEDVSRSDLPPAPVAEQSAPTSPYAQRFGQSSTRDVSEDPHADTDTRLKGAAARTVTNMESSLAIPTATSARAIPAKVLIENRSIINNHLSHTRGGKVSFTHLIGWAVIEALTVMPELNASFVRDDAGKPVLHQPAHVAFGLAIDVPSASGERRLLVPSIKQADVLDLAQFIGAYEQVVARARAGELSVDDFRGTTVTLTNPGMIGTLHSVPRLMPGQGLIVGVGSMAYPAAFAGASDETLARNGVGKTVTITSTYDHRIIQGAQSGEFLALVEKKLLGLDGFWDRAFESLRIPHTPIRWTRDTTYDPEWETGKPARVAELIHAFRQRGHLAADTDPLTYRTRRHPDLDLTSYGLSLWDLDRMFPTGSLGGASHMPGQSAVQQRATLREILQRLRFAYCRTVGIEFMHIQDPEQRRWWQTRLEGEWTPISDEERRRILTKLEQAEAFETFLQTKYVGQKRFSLEGGESLIVALDRLLDAAAHDGLDEVVIGMAHRGRLNVLCNIAGKSYQQIFQEFEGNNVITDASTGDVKYHLGTTGVFSGTDGVSTTVSLAANPSHLETVDGVVEGMVRGKLDRLGTTQAPYTVMPVLVHGDAAFAGQGVVYETLNMSQLPAYRTGGTIHIIVNNQIGFTTGAASARSTNYATDLAKGLQIPIFHINADDPETVARVMRRAYEYRATFHKDVIIDLVCYRRRGHNEGDDPSMTQPVMYRLIDNLPSTREVYTTDLVGRGDITTDEAAAIAREYQAELERIFTETRATGDRPDPSPGFEARGTDAPQSVECPDSRDYCPAITSTMLERIGDAQVAWPSHFMVHPKLQAMLRKRQESTRSGDIDWGMGELLALGSLLMEGMPVRLAGEDARRATFAQRHAVLHDNQSGAEWTPLDFLTPDQARLSIYDSLLSEYAALAFEYGYALERPEGLTIWEAQFGDFANGAQSVIDEYVSSAADKWGLRSGLVMLLPHGQEGQGPDHSSARIERYLQLCAGDNMWLAQPSTPANHFHLLRAQAYRRPRRPLIVFTPKQLLRLKAATSSVEEFLQGGFAPVIGEVDPQIRPERVDRVLMCSGRVYYDLAARRADIGDDRTAIVRLEQLYPLDQRALERALAPFAGAELVWVQDEPANQGAWPFLALTLPDVLTNGVRPELVSRPASSAPAVGSPKVHRAAQEAILSAAFAR